MNARSKEQLTAKQKEECRAMVMQLNGCIRTLALHGEHNKTYSTLLERLSTLIDRILPSMGGRLELQFVDDLLFINGATLSVNAMMADRFRSLSRFLVARGLGGLSIDSSISAESITEWIRLISPQPMTEDQTAELKSKLYPLRGRGIDSLDPRSLAGSEEFEMTQVSSMSFAFQVYARAIVGFREFLKALERGEDPFSGKINLVRVVQDLVDIVRSDVTTPMRILELRYRSQDAMQRSVQRYIFGHAANTCIYALLIGVMMDLDRLALLDLGTCALLAKVGHALLPEEMTERPGMLSRDERRRLRFAMISAVQQLVGESRISDTTMRRVIIAYEHHSPYRHPQTQERMDTHPYARIVAVADAYDAMRTQRAWRKPLIAEIALGSLKKEADRRYDPVVVGVLDALLKHRIYA